MNRIYCDHAATTPLLPEAEAAMADWVGHAGNPSSLHANGRASRDAIDHARGTIADIAGVEFGSVVFGSGGTECVAHALLGLALSRGTRSRALVAATEHHAVLRLAPVLERLGVVVETVPCGASGQIDLDALGAQLGSDVLFVAAMLGQNETGSLNPIADVTRLAKLHGALTFVDACQTFPRIPKLDALGADLLVAVGHKFNGPAGCGILIVKSGVALTALVEGGGQERGRRGGTENTSAIVGTAAAAAWHAAHPEFVEQTRFSRDAFLELSAAFGFIPTPGADLPGIAHGRIPGCDAETLLIRLDRAGVAASSGAACSSGSIEPSHVLQAMGWDAEACKQGLRFSFGLNSTLADASEAAAILGVQVRAVWDRRASTR